jgi:biopolymer transport protein ExbB
MWALFNSGGWMMYPLGLFSVVAFAVFIEKIISLQNRRVLTPEVVHAIENLREPSDIPMAIRTCERYNTPLAHIVRAGLEEAESPGGDARQAMEDTGRREVKRLERYLVVLATAAAASPLMGLLGTVFGMIKVFSVISIEGVGVASRLSGGIAEALITTAFGLLIGIPALVAYNFFDSRVENFVIKIEGNVHLLLKRVAMMRAGSHARVREITDATKS